MVQSLNTKVDFVSDSTAFTGLAEYGKVMIGDKAFEFYNDKDLRKYIQIPWEEVESVSASVLFKGKWIPRYAVQTKRNGTFRFASKNPKQVLRAMREYVGSDKMFQAPSFFDIIKRAFRHKKKKQV